MRVLKGKLALRRPPRAAVVTVGVYDGVHQAHSRIIRKVVREARRVRGTSIVLTFDPDPERVLNPKRPPCELMPLGARLETIEALGVDCVWVIRFTKRFAKTTASVFAKKILIEQLNTRCLIVGETFLFGKDRLGDRTMLEALGHRHGMRVIGIAPIKRAGSQISATRIRKLIQQGSLFRAEELLGRPVALYGTVVRGSGRGRALGFPTANLKLHSHVLPPLGVYAVRVFFGKKARHGVMNLGRRPTFGGGPLIAEVHLFNFSGKLKGHSLRVELMVRLRSERTFKSIEALKRQVTRDSIQARRLIKG